MRRLLLIAALAVWVTGSLPASARPPRLRRQWPNRVRIEKPQRDRDAAPAVVGSMTELEEAVYVEINQYRLRRGLPALRADARLIEQARLHSQAMADRQVPVGHRGFEQRVKRISRQIPSRRVSENVALMWVGQNLPERALRKWLNSPKHRGAIEDRHHLTGVGIVQKSGGVYITQIFVRKR